MEVFYLPNNSKNTTSLTLLIYLILLAYKRSSPKNRPIIMNSIPIFLAATNTYAVPLAVCLYSIIKHSSPENHYHFHIISDDMSPENQATLKQLEKPEQISIDFQNTSDKLNQKAKQIDCGRFSAMSLARLEAADIFPQYEKIVYLDVDTLINGDIAELYHSPLNEAPLAAALDTGCLRLVMKDDVVTPHFLSLPLHHPSDYRNAGVMVMNLKKMRERNLADAFIKKFDSGYKLAFLDQDAINLTLEGEMAYLPPSWNFHYTEIFLTYPEPTLNYALHGTPYEGLNKDFQAKSWKLLHMIGSKPWKADTGFLPAYYLEAWWPIAMECPIFRDEISQLIPNFMRDVTAHTKKLRRKLLYSFFKTRRKRLKKIRNLEELMRTIMRLNQEL